jgi:hypothetical protein
MACYSDVSYLPIRLRLEHSLVKSRAVIGLRAKRGIVELVNIYIIGFEKRQARLKLLTKFLYRKSRSLSGDNYVFSDVRERLAYFFLAVGLKPRGVKIVYTALVCAAKNTLGIFHANALNGQCAESVFTDYEFRPSKSNCLHSSLLKIKSSEPFARAIFVIYLFYHNLSKNSTAFLIFLKNRTFKAIKSRAEKKNSTPAF